VIRLNASGVYDNYISNGNSAYPEIWKLIWQCNGGTPFYFAGGGSFTSNLQFGVLTPPAANLTVSNITGIPTFQLQDIADIVVDPQTNALYTIFTTSEPQLSALNNRIFRHKPPYTASDIVWSVPSGYQVLVEASNRPYLSVMNSVAINALAINASYLFYWDGRNLKAFDKNTGAVAGTPLTIPGNTALMQGGIATDTCNNVFVGDVNGTIKVYQFDGTTFNDAAAPDIIIPGNPAATTYALVYDNWRKNIYAAGTGYVASINVAQYCLPAGYSINLNANCTAASIAATLSPAPPAGSVITYSLYQGAALIGTSTTGIFNGLLPNTNYTIVAIIDIACGGPRAEKTFSLSTPVISLSATPATCTQNIGTITVTAAPAATSYTYSIDGVHFQASNVFSSLSAGSYTISVKNDIGCIVTDTVTVPLSGTNTVSLSAGANATICEGESTVLGATSNAATFLWTPATGLNNPNILNPVASPLVTTKYYIKATTAFCSKTDSVTVLVNPAPVANAGNSVTICFGKDTTLNGSGGVQYSWSPATYLNNPGIANPNVLRPAQSITYQLQVTDNRGCRSTNPATVTVTVRPREQLFAGNDTAVPINQALQLNAIDVNATGFINYLWTPAYGLSNPNIKNPVALPDRDITYTVEASTANDCRTSAAINITVYLKPEIYVPGAFTPNKDGINDLLKAVPTGIKVFRYFAVYNRYGQRVFYTKNAAVGWDGKVKGSYQDNSSYAWMAEGIDYQGKIIKRKGTSILIR
ncbi:MAG: gliding motility-associated C-terminal domain-containing protein, partial [Dinghuibacter sp.]|nr:gliding motility-associated C-terminal domain-containing protein [Dinghuibacter sp.]